MLCAPIGATLVCSTATANLASAAGLPIQQIVTVDGTSLLAAIEAGSPASAPGSFRSGGTSASALPSAHGKVLFGRIPLPGDISTPAPGRPRMWQMKHGQVFLWHLDLGDATVLHVDTAQWFSETRQGR
jgi:hypothetical protein